MKKCTICNKEINMSFRNTNAKYCGETCRKVMRSRVNKVSKERLKNKMQKGDADFVGGLIYNKYKSRAPKRGLTFNLPKSLFIKHYKGECYYCGENMQEVGFDRLDNDKGYEVENVVPCCTPCNMMKRSTNHLVFIGRCISIAKKFTQPSRKHTK